MEVKLLGVTRYMQRPKPVFIDLDLGTELQKSLKLGSRMSKKSLVVVLFHVLVVTRELIVGQKG